MNGDFEMAKYRKLGRTSSQRKALLRNQVTQLLYNGKIVTTEARAKEVVNARKYAIYLAREILDLSYPNLAKEFNKNHTTIMYQYEKLEKDIKTNKAMQIITEELSELIKR